MTAVMNPVPPLSQDDVTVPARGELGLKEKRAWRTWHLVVAIIVSALLGMALDYYTDGGSHSSTPSSSAGAYTPPPPTVSSGSTTTTTSGTNSDTTTTTASSGGGAAAQSSTTTSTSTSAPAVAADPARTYSGSRQLDEYGLHDNRRELEHWMGLSVHARTDGRFVIQGNCVSGRIHVAGYDGHQ